MRIDYKQALQTRSPFSPKRERHREKLASKAFKASSPPPHPHRRSPAFTHCTVGHRRVYQLPSCRRSTKQAPPREASLGGRRQKQVRQTLHVAAAPKCS